MADLLGVHHELCSRIMWVMAEADRRGRKGRAFWITTGFREMPEQIRLYNNWQAALIKAKGNVVKAQKFAPMAAIPGTSMHGRSPALAVDIACDPIDNHLRAQLLAEASLVTPVSGEPWHAQLATVRKPLPVTPQVPLEKATTALGKQAVTIIPTPSGSGYWIVANDGGVFAFGDAQFLGSAGNLKLNAPIVGAAAHPLSQGYWLVGADGGVFAYGASQYSGGPNENNAIGYEVPK